MNIIEKITKEYPLKNRIDCDLHCYELEKKRYLIFWNEPIKKESLVQVLNELQIKTNNSKFTEWKTLIIVGSTNIIVIK